MVSPTSRPDRHRDERLRLAVRGEGKGESVTSKRVQEIVSKRLGPPPARPTKAEIEAGACKWCWMDALEDHVMSEGLQELIEERKRGHSAAAIRARRSARGGPSLCWTGGQRAGLVGADRFKGRYVPHLVGDNDE
jgi:hypothetical protein